MIRRLAHLMWQPRSKWFQYPAFILTFAVIGGIVQFATHALTPTTAVESENGTVSSSASVITDSSASNGHGVKFGDGTMSSSPPPAAGYFTTMQPVGSWSTLPSGSSCSAQVHRSSWEPRPDNTKRNHTMPDAAAVQAAWASHPRSGEGTYNIKWDTWLLARVDGQYSGTTDEIFQWAACKWGLPDNFLRAEANQESTWYQYLVYPTTHNRCVSNYGCGDFFKGTEPLAARTTFCNMLASTGGYDYQQDYGAALCPETFSILGIKSWWSPAWGFNYTDNQNGTFPFNRDSTAFAADYMASQIRGCYEGWQVELGSSYTSGDLWGCAGAWFSGSWHDTAADGYAGRVQTSMDTTRPWLAAGFATDKPPCSATYGCPGPDTL